MLCAATSAGTACIDFSPFTTDLDDSERDHTERNLERLQGGMQRALVADRPLRIALLSDTHSSYDELAEIVELIRARDDVAFVLHLGDLSDYGLRHEYSLALEHLQRLDVPFVTAVGNHDLLSNGPDLYRAMFGDYNYSFTYGEVRVVMLNTNTWETPDDVPSLAWVKRETAPSSDAHTVIVAAHQRPHERAMEKIFADNGVAAQLTGHIHDMGTYRAEGVPGLCVGAVVRGYWAMVVIDAGKITMETCRRSTCTAIEP